MAARSTPQAQRHANRAPGGVPDDGYAQVFWTAFRRSANAMFVAGLDRRIVAVNDAGTALAGRSADALTGERMTTLLDDPAEAPDDAAWRAQVLRGESYGRRRIRRPDGSTRVVDFAMRATRTRGTVLVLGVCIRNRGGGGRRSEPAHRVGNATTCWPRTIVQTCPSSSGCRSASRLGRANSDSSSRNRTHKFYEELGPLMRNGSPDKKVVVQLFEKYEMTPLGPPLSQD